MSNTFGPTLPELNGAKKGRCFKCGIAYYWTSSKFVLARWRDPAAGKYRATCNRCGGRLRATTHVLRSVPWEPLNV